MAAVKEMIAEGRAVLGIEFGSTRIKAVLIGPDNVPVATGVHDWENRHVDRLWTYTLDDIHDGLKNCYADLRRNVIRDYGVEIEQLAAIGISAMMHGYMAF
ncbi:MAG: ATPase, partial [Duncaniella sp.]|nr:ATPase [Duncaniella sp.]